jgi:hypothetical protein
MYRGYYSPSYRSARGYYPYGGYGGYPYGGYGGYPYGGGGYPYGGYGGYGGTAINAFQSQIGYQNVVNTGIATNVSQVYSPFAIY